MNSFAQAALGLSTEDGEVVADALLINPEETLAQELIVVDASGTEATEADEGLNQIIEAHGDLEALGDKLSSDLDEGKVLSTEAYHYAAQHFQHVMRNFAGLIPSTNVGYGVSTEALGDEAQRREVHKQFVLSIEEAKKGFLSGLVNGLKASVVRTAKFVQDYTATQKAFVERLAATKRNIRGLSDDRKDTTLKGRSVSYFGVKSGRDLAFTMNKFAELSSDFSTAVNKITDQAKEVSEAANRGLRGDAGTGSKILITSTMITPDELEKKILKNYIRAMPGDQQGTSDAEHELSINREQMLTVIESAEKLLSGMGQEKLAAAMGNLKKFNEEVTKHAGTLARTDKKIEKIDPSLKLVKLSISTVQTVFKIQRRTFDIVRMANHLGENYVKQNA